MILSVYVVLLLVAYDAVVVPFTHFQSLETKNHLRASYSTYFWSTAAFVLVCILVCALNSTKVPNQHRVCDISFSGEPADSLGGPHILVISNHVSLLDYLILGTIANSNGKLCYFMTPYGRAFAIPSPSQMLHKWLPNMVTSLDKEPPKARSFKKRFSFSSPSNYAAETLLQPALESPVPSWIVMFPEEESYSKERSREFAMHMYKQGFSSPLYHVLYPRFARFNQTVAVVRKAKTKFDTKSKARTLVDMTLQYDASVLSAFSLPESPRMSLAAIYDVIKRTYAFFVGDYSKISIHIHLRNVRLARVPTAAKRSSKWLERTWIEKDRLLGSKLTSVN